MGKLIKYLWVFVFILGQFARIPLSNGINLNLLDIVVVLYVGISFLTRKYSFQGAKYLLLFALTELLVLIGLVLPHFGLNSFLASFLYLFRLIFYWLVYFVLIKRKVTVSSLKNSMMVAGVGIVGIGYIQYFFYANLRNLYYLGWDDHLYRLFSTFLDPNFAGAFLSLFALLLVHIIRGIAVKNKQFYGYLFLLTTTLIGVMLTYSRTALLMLIVGIFLYFFTQGYKKTSITTVLICLMGFILFANTKLEGLNPLRTASTFARLETITKSVSVFESHPLLGTGYNAYRYEQIEKGSEKGEIAYTSHAYAGGDNSYLFLLATTGVFGTILYLLFLSDLYTSVTRQIKKEEKAYILAITGAFLAGGFFINLLFFTPLLLWMIIQFAVIRNS